MNRGIVASGKASKNSSFFKAPIRILTKARDLYIRSFSECAGRVDFNGGLGCPAPVYISTLPRSYSTVSSSSTGSYSSARDDDLSELVRIASARGMAKKVEAEVLRRRSTGGGAVTRSQSVGIGRIDEDKVCDFDDDDDGDGDVKVKLDVMYPRSKSHTPLSARNGLF